MLTLLGSKVSAADVYWIATAFLSIYICHLTLYILLPYLVTMIMDGQAAAVVARRINCMKLSRFSVDIGIMIWFSFLGFEVLHDFAGWSSFVTDGSDAVSRVYRFSSSGVFLARLQVAYEAKNLVDSFVFGDGIVFVFHHIITGFLAFFALHPYLHIYSSFFFGISEVSTVALCVLACFDESRGLLDSKGKNLFAQLYPATMKIVGIVFALLFVAIR